MRIADLPQLRSSGSASAIAAVARRPVLVKVALSMLQGSTGEMRRG
jgi:hypothetical protein